MFVFLLRFDLRMKNTHRTVEPHMRDRMFRESVRKEALDLKHYHKVSPDTVLTFSDITKTQSEATPTVAVPVETAGKPSPALATYLH